MSLTLQNALNSQQTSTQDSNSTSSGALSFSQLLAEYQASSDGNGAAGTTTANAPTDGSTTLAGAVNTTVTAPTIGVSKIPTYALSSPTSSAVNTTILANPTSTGTSSTSNVGTSSATVTTANASDANNSEYSALDKSSYSKDASSTWGAFIPSGTKDSDQQAKEMNRPLAAAEILADPNSTADEKKAATDFINSNPAVKTALEASSKSGSITDPEGLQNFITRTKQTIQQGQTSIDQYKSANPKADAQSLQMAQEDATMIANSPLIMAADDDGANGKKPSKGLKKYMQDDSKDGGIGYSKSARFTVTSLQKMAQDNPGLSSVVSGTCATWSQQGMFDSIDVGRKGDIATEKKDGKVGLGDLIGWNHGVCPTNATDSAAFVQQAAKISSTKGTDTSKLNSDIFDNPQNYTGAQKAAVLMQLVECLIEVEAGANEKIENCKDTIAELTQRIKQLSSDTDTQTYLKTYAPQFENQIIDNPEMSADPSGLAKTLSTLSPTGADSTSSVPGASTSGGSSGTNGVGSAALVGAGVAGGALVAGAGSALTRQLLQSGISINADGTAAADATAAATTGTETATTQTNSFPSQGQYQVPNSTQTENQNQNQNQNQNPDPRGLRQAGQAADKLLNGSSDAAEGASAAEGAAEGAEGAAAGAEGAAAGAEGAAAGAEGAAAAAGAATGAAAGAEGAAAGAAVGAEAAAGAAGGVLGAMSATGVGTVVAALAGVGIGIYAIVEAIKKDIKKAHFGSVVNSTLDQFGITKPH